MKLWHAKHEESGTIRAAGSDADLRAKILPTNLVGPWAITYGEAPTDKASIVAIIDGVSAIFRRVEARAVYEIREGKVAKVREGKK